MSYVNVFIIMKTEVISLITINKTLINGNTSEELKNSVIPVLLHGEPGTAENWLRSFQDLCPEDNDWIGLVEGVIYLYKGFFQKADSLIKDSVEIFSVKNDALGLQLAMLFESKLFAHKGDFEGSIVLSEYIITSSPNHTNPNIYYNAVIQKLLDLAVMGEFDMAISAAEEGAEFLKRHGNDQLSESLQGYLVIPYCMMGDYNRAFHYYQQVDAGKADPAGAACGSRFLADLLIAKAYCDTGNPEKSRELFERTIQLEKELGYSEIIYLTYYFYSMFLWNVGEYGTALRYAGLAEDLSEDSDAGRWFLNLAVGFKSLLLSKCGKTEEGLLIARSLLEKINGREQYLSSEVFFHIGLVLLQQNEYSDAEKCLLKALSISKITGAGLTECYSSGLLSHICAKSGRTGTAEEYAEACLDLADAGGYLQGFVTIPELDDCMKTGIMKSFAFDFVAKVLQKLDTQKRFRSFIDSLKISLFISKINERNNILKMLDKLKVTGNVSGIPTLFVCVFGEIKVYVTGRGLDTSGWRTNKAKELFAYLLNKKGEATSSEKLITELWPGSFPDKARNLLYTNIVYVKYKLNSWGLAGSLKKVQNGYLVEEAGILCDKWLADIELDRGRSGNGNELPEWLLKLIRKKFMLDVYSDWVLDEENRIVNTVNKRS
jgi:tetratricopeptide (TPR) repeat protein